MTRLLSVYPRDPSNVGDMACCPKTYFPAQLAGATEVPLLGLTRDRVQGAAVVLGGGGILGGQFFADEMRALREAASARECHVIVWGAGHNVHGVTGIDFDILAEQVEHFDLVGLRDWGTEWTWVPDVSCLSSEFDEPVPGDYGPLVYEHKDVPLHLDDRYHVKTNGSFLCMGAAVRYLARGQTIITNSYHGAYWATLLGRVVRVCEAFSSRFYTMRFSPLLSDRPSCLGEDLSWYPSYPDALPICRRATRRFARRVFARLAELGAL